jgi:hypothetical protein
MDNLYGSLRKYKLKKQEQTMLVLEYDQVCFKINELINRFTSDEKTLTTTGLKVRHKGIVPGIEVVILTNDKITLNFYLETLDCMGDDTMTMEYIYPSLAVAKFMMNCFLAAQNGEEFELPIKVSREMLEDLKSPYVITLDQLIWTPMSRPELAKEPATSDLATTE